MKTSAMKESKFLKKEDVGDGVPLTIIGVESRNVAMTGEPAEPKWCLLFKEVDKPLVLNSTNLQLCERIFKSDETDDWIGKTIVLYEDPNVSYAGKIVGGIRVRALKLPTAKANMRVSPKQPVTRDMSSGLEEDDDSKVPF